MYGLSTQTDMTGLLNLTTIGLALITICSQGCHLKSWLHCLVKIGGSKEIISFLYGITIVTCSLLIPFGTITYTFVQQSASGYILSLSLLEMYVGNFSLCVSYYLLMVQVGILLVTQNIFLVVRNIAIYYFNYNPQITAYGLLIPRM